MRDGRGHPCSRHLLAERHHEGCFEGAGLLRPSCNWLSMCIARQGVNKIYNIRHLTPEPVVTANNFSKVSQNSPASDPRAGTPCPVSRSWRARMPTTQRSIGSIFRLMRSQSVPFSEFLGFVMRGVAPGPLTTLRHLLWAVVLVLSASSNKMQSSGQFPTTSPYLS